MTAVSTMLKMMKNMSANFTEDKFKRIRLGNANFNSKVGGIDGGLEVSRYRRFLRVFFRLVAWAASSFLLAS